MSKNDEVWCRRCFLVIKDTENAAFKETGMCIQCNSELSGGQLGSQLKSSNYSEWESITPNRQSGSYLHHDLNVKMEGANMPSLFLALLILLPPLDFILFDSSLPYVYFAFLRLIAFGAFGLMAYTSRGSGKKIGELDYTIAFIGLALLYNPFLPAELGREIWTVVNIATVGILIHFNFMTGKLSSQTRSHTNSAAAKNANASQPITQEENYKQKNVEPTNDLAAEIRSHSSNVADHVLHLLNSSTLGTQFNSGDGFRPAKEFFENNYIRGFIIGMFTGLMEYDGSYEQWSTEHKGDFVFSGLKKIDPFNIVKQCLTNPYMQKNPTYLEGINDAGTLVGAMYNKLKPDDPDPKLLEARSMAASFDGLDGDPLAAAVVLVTIRRHIHEKWGSGDVAK